MSCAEVQASWANFSNFEFACATAKRFAGCRELNCEASGPCTCLYLDIGWPFLVSPWCSTLLPSHLPQLSACCVFKGIAKYWRWFCRWTPLDRSCPSRSATVNEKQRSTRHLQVPGRQRHAHSLHNETSRYHESMTSACYLTRF